MTQTWAVIGHGLSPEGRTWGGLIDECDVVIRMWNWNYQWNRPQDYGKKYTYGFYEISPTEMARFWRYNKAKPDQFWIGSQLKEYTGELPAPTTVVDPSRWEADGRALGGEGVGKRLRLTRGARAALWALERIPSGTGRVVLVGFDSVKAGMGLPTAEAFP